VSGGTRGRKECRREILEEGKALKAKGNGNVAKMEAREEYIRKNRS